ncbi:MAG: DinB family protein, partial [Myxococcota bacterium]
MTRNPNLDLPPPAPVAHRDQGDALPPGDAWWTGKHPRACPGMRDDGVLASLPPLDTARCTRQDVIDYFDNGWTLTELLFQSLRTADAFFRPPYHQLRHPLVFYYTHPAALFVNKLRVGGLLPSPIDPYFEQLFETGVDEMSWDDLSRDAVPWPSVREVHAYRARVYAAVRRVLAEHPGLDPGHPPILRGHPLWAVLMGCEHERIHLETSSVLIRELPVDLVRRPEAWPPLHPSARAHRPGAGFRLPEPGRDYPEGHLVEVEPGTVTIGKPEGHPSFG